MKFAIVVVTILDSVRNNQISDAGIDDRSEKRKAAATNIAGLWKGHDSVLSVDDTVREMLLIWKLFRVCVINRSFKE